MKKALFIRLDRMGDLILTLPCDQPVSGQYHVQWVIPKGLDFVIEHSQPQRRWFSFSKEFSWTQLREFYRLLRKERFDVSVSFHVPWWINLTLFLSRVPTRGGVLSQWHSHLFLNKGLRQKRSRCEAHEMEYNYQLVEYTFDLQPNTKTWSSVQLSPPKSLDALIDDKTPYVVVHPGMGGSALNWPTEKYAELINQVSEKYTVVITGTKNDDAYLKPLKLKLNNNTRVVWLDKQLSGVQLLKLLSQAHATVAPSTGVIHLSASLGVPSYGIYSPIKVHRDSRWGPKGSKVQTFTPQVQCPAHFECLGQSCSDYFCMTKLKAKTVAEKILH